MRHWINLIEGHQRFSYLGNCTNSHVASGLEDMMDSAEEISYEEMLSVLGKQELSHHFPQFDWSSRPRDLTMKNDYAVSYYKSTFRGKPCYYIRESGIEYIFVDENYEIREPKTKKSLGVAVSADGQTGRLIDISAPIFYLIPHGKNTVELTQSSAASKDSAQKVIEWLLGNNIATVIEDDEEKPVGEVIDWLKTI